MQKENEAFRQQMVEKGKANRAKAAQFLASNKGRKGIVTLPSGLQYVGVEGGRRPEAEAERRRGDPRHRGTHLDGKQFDASDPAQGPLRFQPTRRFPVGRKRLG
jgi:FKBP-type peptidyl-prolyl cis-trans isomerase